MSEKLSSKLNFLYHSMRSKVHIEIEQQAEFPLSLNDRTKVQVIEIEPQAESPLSLNDRIKVHVMEF